MDQGHWSGCYNYSSEPPGLRLLAASPALEWLLELPPHPCALKAPSLCKVFVRNSTQNHWPCKKLTFSPTSTADFELTEQIHSRVWDSCTLHEDEDKS